MTELIMFYNIFHYINYVLNKTENVEYLIISIDVFSKGTFKRINFLRIMLLTIEFLLKHFKIS